MASSFHRRAFPKLILIAAALAAGVFLSRGGDNSNVSAIGNYTATTDVNLACTSAPGLCPSANAASAVADQNVILNIPASDMNFGNVVTLSAQGGCIAGEPVAGVDCGAGVRPVLGDVIGTLSSDTNLGLTNTPCSGFLIVTFVFINASTNNSASNVVNGSNQYEADAGGIQSPLLKDVYVVAADDIQNGNDVSGSASAASAPSVTPANGIPAHVERYPYYLNTIFDPDGPLGATLPVAPMARYSGGQVVAGTSVILTLLNFAPGALNAFNAPHPLADLDDANLGYTSVSVLQDPTRPPTTGSITDFCAPLLVNTVVFGESRGNVCNGNAAPPCNTDVAISNPAVGLPTTRVRYQNPSTVGTHYYGGFHNSLRNSDGDAYENALDTCPYAVNTENPKSDGGPDADMLDSVCDPGPAAPNNNQDGDSSPTGGAWSNAQDNCPLVANTTNAQDELDFSLQSSTNPEASRRPRGGPESDTLGNECDAAEVACGANVDDDADTLVNDGCATVGGAVAETTCTFSTSAEVDNDLDGYPNDGCALGGGSPEAGADCEDYVNDDSGDDALVNDGCPAQGGAEFGCLNSSDDDADGSFNDGCPSSARVVNGHFHTTFSLVAQCIGSTDADGDGYCATGGAGVANDSTNGSSDTDAARIPETYSQFRPFPVAHAGSGNSPPASREPVQVCSDGLDNDGDTLVDLLDGTLAAAATNDDCRPPDSIFTAGDDTDGDGSRDEVEIHLGTNPLARCARGFDVNGSTPSNGWGLDLRGESATSADKVNVTDLGTFVSGLKKNGTSPGDAGFNRRWDLRPGTAVGKWIGVADLAAVATVSPVAMHGVRAFGFFSVCSSHKVLND